MNKTKLALLLGALSIPVAAESLPAVFLVTKAAAVRSFDGFYVGGHVGPIYKRQSFLESSDDVIVDKRSKSQKAYGFFGGVHAGYGQNVGNKYWWGIEASLSRDSTNKERSIAAFNGGKFYYSYSRKYVYGLTPRFGSVISPTQLVYVRLGFEYSHDVAKARYERNPDKSTWTKPHSFENAKRGVSDMKLSFVPGFGYEHALTPKILTRIEYAYNFGSQIKLSDNTSLGYSAHVVKVGLSYKF